MNVEYKKKLLQLKSDLSAETVIKQEEIEFINGYNEFTSEGPHCWEVTKPKITEPDTKTRKAAEQELRTIYASSDQPYSARYFAGQAIGIGPTILSGELVSWLPDLQRKLHAELQDGTKDEWFTNESNCNFGGPEDNYPVTVPNMVPDSETRQSAALDLAELFLLTKSDEVKKLLKICYGDFGDEIYRNTKTVVKIAGKALGYSSLRILLSTNGLAVQALGSILVLVAIGVGYGLHKLVSK